MMSPTSWRWMEQARRHPVALDMLLAVVVVTVSLLGHLSIRDPEIVEPSFWTVLLIVAVTATILARRRWPVAALLLAQIGETLQAVFNILGSSTIVMLVTAYSVGRYCGWRRTITVAAISITGITIAITWGAIASGQGWTTALPSYLYIVVPHTVAFSLGSSVRLNHQRAAQLEARAERAEREQELIAQQQLQSERTRIARELHDVVAHGVSTMVLHAAAARRHLLVDPRRAAEAIGTVEDVGRQAMHEMRQLLGVLRSDESADRSPQPQLENLPRLVSSMPELRVQLATPPLDSVPTAVSLNAYRVVQEALVNASRHAGPGTHVVVSLALEPDRLDVTVVDDGPGRSVATVPSTGFGIIGMRERVNVHGGTLSAGPGAHGGWRVHASFPFGFDDETLDQVMA